MPDLRELLHLAAGDPPDLPDFESIQRRARPRIIRKRVAAAAISLAVCLAAWPGTVFVLENLDERRVDAVDHAPDPTGTPSKALREGLLEPATYGGKVGRYDVLLETRNDAWAAAVVNPNWLALTYQEFVLHLQLWESVVAPAADDASARQDPPADMVSWLAAHPRLSTSAPVKVRVAGLTATQLDVRVVKPLSVTPGECTGRCVLLGRVAGDGELVDLEVDQRARFLVFGPSDHQLVVFYRAPERRFAVLDGAVQALLAEMRLEISG